MICNPAYKKPLPPKAAPPIYKVDSPGITGLVILG